jgi:hypothetical protein
MGTSPDIRNDDALGTGCPQAVFRPAIDHSHFAAECSFLSGGGSGSGTTRAQFMSWTRGLVGGGQSLITGRRS